MSQKTQPEKQGMSSMQKQAVLVCVICALAALLTVSITLTLLKRGKEPEAPSSSAAASEEETTGDDLSDHYQINQESAALLTETADAGDDYLNDVLFLGDSNTVRLYNNGLISLQQFCAKEGIGTQAALNEPIVTFKKDSNVYTIPEAVAKMKPRRVVMTFGTNDADMETSDFIANYTALVQAIQSSYPYTDIIVNTVPPIPENHSNYPNMDQRKIDDFNMALLNMCEQLGVKFLNSAEVLKGEDGYGVADYYNNGDIHLTPAGLKTILSYIRTHAYLSEERRPDVSNIPTRTLDYASNPSSAVQAPSSSSEAVSSSETPASSASSESQSQSTSTSESTKEEQKQYEVSYRVDKNGGGTLSIGKDTGKSSLKYTVTDSSKSLTVTAVPEENHVFVKWSDGITSKTRKDTNFTENMDVTAVFAPLSLKITGERAAQGASINFRASINGKYGSTDSIRWYANGVEVKEAAGHSSVTVQVTDTHAATYKVHAVVTYNDCSVTSNMLTISIVNGSSSSSSSSSSGASSGSTSSSSGSSSSHSSSSSSTSSSHSSSSSSSSSHSSSSASTSSSSSSASSSHSTPSSTSASSESKSESKSDSKSETASSSSKPASSENDTPASSSSQHASSSSESSKTEASASTSKAE